MAAASSAVEPTTSSPVALPSSGGGLAVEIWVIIAIVVGYPLAMAFCVLSCRFCLRRNRRKYNSSHGAHSDGSSTHHSEQDLLRAFLVRFGCVPLRSTDDPEDSQPGYHPGSLHSRRPTSTDAVSTVSGGIDVTSFSRPEMSSSFAPPPPYEDALAMPRVKGGSVVKFYIDVLSGQPTAVCTFKMTDDVETGRMAGDTDDVAPPGYPDTVQQ